MIIARISWNLAPGLTFRMQTEIARLLREASALRSSAQDDAISEVRRKNEEEAADMMAKVQQELENVRRAKQEEVASLQKKYLEDAQSAAEQQETEMIELKSEWEKQMHDLRRQHEEHMKVAISKDLIAEELDRVTQSLLQRDEEMANMQTRHDEEKTVIFQERLAKEEELSEAKQEVRELAWKNAKQQEELVMLRGSLRRAEDDERRLTQEVDDLRAATSSRELDFKTLNARNLSLEDDCNAKDDTIAQLQSMMDEHQDVRARVHEHDAGIDRFRALELLELQRENAGLKVIGDKVKLEVDSLRDELRSRATDLHDTGRKLDVELSLIQKTLSPGGGLHGELEKAREEIYARQVEAEGLHRECQMLRSEVARFEELATAQAAQVEEAKAAAHAAEAVGWDRAKLQEELVVLRGTSRRKDEDRLKLDIELASLKESTRELEGQLRAKQEEVESVAQESHKTIEEQVRLRILAQSEAQAANLNLQQQIYILRGEHAQQLDALSQARAMPEHVQESVRALELAQSELAATQDELATKAESVRALEARLQDTSSQLEKAELAETELREKIMTLDRSLQEVSSQLEKAAHAETELREKVVILERDGAEHRDLAESAVTDRHRHMEEISTLKAHVRRAQDEREKQRAVFESQIVDLQVRGREKFSVKNREDVY